MIGIAWFQTLLFGVGWVLAQVYRAVPNYGVSIILLTLGMRVLLLPLGIKQIRSMQEMQAIQPRVKQLQQKYKGNRQKLNEETMALYKEHGVNPFGGCLPLIMQFPVLIALFAVLRVPGGLAHIPNDSRLHADIQAQHTTFLGANLLCSAVQAGREIPITYPKGTPETHQLNSNKLDCGDGIPVRIPYFVFAGLMVFTTYYQQRQMQRASPGAVNQQQQALTRVMPILFGVWGFIFQSGLVVYWTTTNLVQIGQQHFMLPRLAAQQEARTERDGNPPSRGEGRGGGGRPRTGGRPGRPGQPGTSRSGGGAASRGRSGGGGGAGRSGGRPGLAGGAGRGQGQRGSTGGRPGRSATPSDEGAQGRDGGSAQRGQGGGGKPPSSDQTQGQNPPAGPRSPGSGGGDAGDRKKRRKR